MKHHHPKVLFICGFLTLLGVSLFVGSCTESTNTPQTALLKDTNGISSSGTLKLDGEIISVPSPTIIAILLQKAQIPFRADGLNSVANRTKYVNEHQKAMNLGVYGADLAYVTNFEKGQLNNDYFGCVGGLAGDLGVLDHVDHSLVSRMNSNISNRDSLLFLNAQFFHSIDQYLKSNEMQEISSLILLGGWIEALHLSLDGASSNTDIRNRLGEQKHAAQSLNKIISRLSHEALRDLRPAFEDLADSFKGLESSYKFAKPITDGKNKITYITSKTAVSVSDDELADLRNKIETIRNLIIQ